jgi:hypothetical protein
MVDESFIFIDDGISGAEFTNRPGFLRLMNALRPRAPFQALIMSDESRLVREAIETAYALKQIITAGVRVFFYLENRERTLEKRLNTIEGELSNLSETAARGGAGPAVLEALTRRDSERRDLMAERARLDRVTPQIKRADA